MRRKLASIIAIFLSLTLLLGGCKGNPLPSGMAEEALLDAGRDVLLLLVEGDYEAVYEALRDDVAEGTSPQAIEELVLRQLDGAGTYRQIDSTLATGQSSGGERYGVAVLYCQFTAKQVLFRLAFDPDMRLIGMEIRPQ